MTSHILRCGAYTIKDMQAALPGEFHSPAARAFTEKKKLGGIHLLLTHNPLAPRWN